MSYYKKSVIIIVSTIILAPLTQDLKALFSLYRPKYEEAIRRMVQIGMVQKRSPKAVVIDDWRNDVDGLIRDYTIPYFPFKRCHITNVKPPVFLLGWGKRAFRITTPIDKIMGGGSINDLFAFCGYSSEAGDILSANGYWCVCSPADFGTGEFRKGQKLIRDDKHTTFEVLDYTKLGDYPPPSCQDIKPDGIIDIIKDISAAAADAQQGTQQFRDLIQKLKKYVTKRNLDPFSPLKDILADVQGYAQLISGTTSTLSQSPEKKTILPVQPTICANGKCIAIGSIYISFYKSCGANVALPPGAAETMGALASASAGTAASLNFPAALGAKFGIDVNEFVNDVIGGASGFLTDVGGFLTGSQRISSPARVPPYPCTITTREPSGTFMGWKKSGYTFFDNNESGSMYALCRIGADPTLLKQFNAWCVCDISKNERFNNFATCEIPPCKSLFKSKKISLPRMK